VAFPAALYFRFVMRPALRMGGSYMTSASDDTLVLGTAGHIDHGKTALVRALTGVDTDRLPEEKARGITIELGFAPLVLPSGRRLGVVDVPGHEALVRTMVAGASGIDLVLLVVAADEGVMPQTREHLAIVSLLGIRHGVVALTKQDVAEPDVAELAEAEVRELVAAGSLAGAPILRVSSLTGAGIDALRGALDEVAASAAARTARLGPPRLWVDRVFEMRGFGTVVTGTLSGGALHVGDTAELLPGGRRARIRGLQSFGEAAEVVQPGARCAVNLQGVATEEIERGALLTAPDALAPTETMDAEIAWLPDAPPLGPKPVAVELLVGTTARRAHAAPIGAEALAPGRSKTLAPGGSKTLAPGARGFARVHLEDGAAPLLPGDAFVLRGFARMPGGGSTLGGGRVLDAHPPKRRCSDPALAAELTRLARGDTLETLRVRIARAGFAGNEHGALRRETGLEPAALDAALAALEQEGALARSSDGLLLDAAACAELERRLLAALGDFHAREPMRPGIPRGALRAALPENVPAPAFELVLARLAASGAIAAGEGLVRSAGFAPRLSERQRALAERLRAEARAAGLEPPTPRDWAAQLGAEPGELRDVLAHLEREGALVHAPGELWFDRASVDALRARVIAQLEAHGALDTPAYKELIGTTRKYAVPLMELFDAEHLTLRRGATRVLRRTRPGRDVSAASSTD
jgi:selenocysteine-specific elongation factor